MKNKIIEQALKIKKEQGQKSILAFAQHFLPHYLKHKTSKFHREIYETLFEMSRERGKKLAVAAPRGYGKSTLVTLVHVLYSICYGTEKFIVILSNTASQAIPILDNIKREFKENDDLRYAFPEVCDVNICSRLMQCWKKDRIVTANNIEVMVLGAGQKIRGRRSGADRPTLIIADDLENADNTFSADSRDKLRDIFEASIRMAGSEETNFIFIGNLYHPHCLLGEYIRDEKDNTWLHKVYSAIEKFPDRMDLWGAWANILNYKLEKEEDCGREKALEYYEENKVEMDKGAVLLWPERYTLYALMVMREENDISFLSEMQNQPLDPRKIVFNTDEFHYWDASGRSVEDLMHSLGKDVEFYGACDPSLGKDMAKGDYSAIVVLAKVTNAMYVIAADIQRRDTYQIVDDILSFCVRYKFIKFSIETNVYQILLVDLAQKKAADLGIHAPFEPINNSRDKTARIQTLRLWTKNGALQFSKKHKKLLEEFRYFPGGRYDDGIDALEMAVREIHMSGGSISEEEKTSVMRAAFKGAQYHDSPRGWRSRRDDSSLPGLLGY